MSNKIKSVHLSTEELEEIGIYPVIEGENLYTDSNLQAIRTATLLKLMVSYIKLVDQFRYLGEGCTYEDYDFSEEKLAIIKEAEEFLPRL